MVQWKVRVSESDGIGKDRTLHHITPRLCNEEDWDNKLATPAIKDSFAIK